METPNPNAAPGHESGETPASPELARGACIGRYVVLALVGKGGMGEVYAAYDPELDRKVALKLLRAETSAGVDPSEGRTRLLREAQAIARLSDPNVVTVFDVGTFGNQVFLAMEFVDGNTLGYWLQAKQRTWREVLNAFSAAGRGLAGAHKAGVVHRDFKPDNVMIGRDGEIRVMDFGLARTMDPATEGVTDSMNAVPRKTPGGRTAGSVATPARTVPAGESSLEGVIGAAELFKSAPRSAGALALPGAGRSEPTGVVAPDGPSAPVPTVVPPSASAVVAARLTGRGSAAVPAAVWNDGDMATRDLSKAPAPFLPPDLASPPLNAPLTVTGAMMGTPAYMAPEQFQGKSIDARTDQFSFCVALYEGLYGERPFQGKSLQDLCTNVVAGRMRPTPSQAKVPGWLRRILLRGLRVERGDRYPSMEALLAALAHDPARSRRRWAAATTVTAAFAVLGMGLVRADRQQRMRCLGADAKLAGVWELPDGKGLSPRKEAIRRAFMATGKRYAADSFTLVMNTLDRYVTEWNDMHRDSCEATNMRGEQSAEVLDLRTSCLHDRFSEVRALTSVFSDATSDVVSKSAEAVQAIRPVEQCADIAALRAVVRPPNDPAVRREVADVRTGLADVKALAGAGRYKQARKNMETVLESARHTKYQPVVAEALLQRAHIETDGGDSSQAEKDYEEAVWRAESSGHAEVVGEATAQLIFVVGVSQNRPVDAHRWARHSAAVLERLGPGHDLIAAWRANNLASVLDSEGNLAEALQTFAEALRIKTRMLGEMHYDVALSLTNMAVVLQGMGRTDEAIEKNRRALDIVEKTLGPDHPSRAVALSNGAEFLNDRGRYAEAQAFAEQALALLQPEVDVNHPNLATSLTALGASWVGREQPSFALPHLERALEILQTRDPNPERLGSTRFMLAQALWQSHATKRAMNLAEQARSDYRASSLGKKEMPGIQSWLEARQALSPPLTMR